MSDDANRWKPKACPHCGHDGAFDSKGPFSRKTATRRLDVDGKIEKLERWDHIHCPNCGNEFAMLDKQISKTFDVDGKELPAERELITDGGQPSASGNESAIGPCECEHVDGTVHTASGGRLACPTLE